MTDTSLSPRTEEILRGGELAELHARVAPGSDLGSAATVRDVAEAAGLPEADVVAHLQQIRAESAFSEPRVGRPSPLPWIAGATLLVGLGVTWWRIHPDTTVPTTNWMPSVSGPVVRPFVTTQVPNRTQGEGIERPTPGLSRSRRSASGRCVRAITTAT